MPFDEPEASCRGEPAQLSTEDHVCVRGGRVDEDDVGERIAAAAQHAHDRGDAAAGGDEQDPGRTRVRERELAARLI